MLVEIYGLFDPDTDELRYVGKARDSAKRLATHIREKHLARPVNRWVCKIIESGKLPVVKVLETVQAGQWEQAEKRLIAHYRQSCSLLNLADGGAMPSQTKEQRQRAAKRSNEVQRQHPKEWRKLQEAKKYAGIILAQDMRAKRYSEAYCWRFRLKLWAAEDPELFGCWAAI